MRNTQMEDASAILALAAGVLNGILEPQPRHYGHEYEPDLDVLRPLNVGLVDDDGSLTRTLKSFLSAVRVFQRKAECRYGGVSPEEWKALLLDRNPAVRKELSNAFSEKSQLLSLYCDVDLYAKLRNGAKGRRQLLKFAVATDLIPEEEVACLDFMLHPRLMLENPPMGRAFRMVGQTHGTHALVCFDKSMDLWALSEPHWREFLRLLNDSQPVCYGHGGGGFRQASLIFHIRSSGWRDELTRYRFNNALLINAEGQISSEEDFCLQAVLDSWGEVLSEELTSRAKGDSRCGWMQEGDQVKGVFQERHQAFSDECLTLGVHSPILRDLPAHLYRLLRLFAPWMMRDEERVDVMDESFRHAVILRDRHRGIVDRLEEGRVHMEHVELAKKLYDRICQYESVSLRDLVRTFDVQKTSLYLPTLRLMVQAGLIQEKQPKVYSVVQIQDVGAAMDRARTKGGRA